ncbi:hypothetical protein C0989_010538 [Termitomyces sp. Mn162]|nr:hypothetical protein C0989_010538 [Termitomyces sp. Mn162]
MDEAAAAGTAANTKGGKKAKSQPAAGEDKKRKPAKGSHGVEKLKKANIYVEKATQTLQIDKLVPSPNPSQRRAQNLQEYGPRQHEEASTTYHSDEESVPVGAAYTYSESLYLSHNLESSSSRSYRAPKPAQLPRRRPNRIQNQVKRVVSFPETSELKSLSDNLSIPPHDGSSLRVVSLPGPELESNPNLGSPGSTGDNALSYVEYLDSSLDTSYHSSGTGSVHPNARSFPPSDVPTTPSPPSSPQSVLVIKNELRVSKPFIRQYSLSSSKICDAEDEAGWITWASSPPRPIPALHGPLSLPYARCPSGAEGTIIEDADLPRMIWGLDLEDTQSNTVREAPPPKSPQPDTASVDSQALRPSNQVLYDSTSNSQPIHKHLDDKEIRRDLENTILRAKPQPFASVPEILPQAMHEVCPDKSRVWDDSPIDIHKLTSYVQNKPSIDPLQKTSSSPSVSSAFIPAPPRHRFSPSMTPRIFIEPRPGSQITPGPRLSAIEIAQRYRAERQQSILQPLSPTWSPTASLDFSSGPFSLDSSSSQSHYEHEFATSFNSRIHTRPSNFSRRDIPAEARPTEAAHRELNNIVNLPSVTYSDPSFNSRTTETSFVRPTSALDMSLILKRLPRTVPVNSRSQSQDTPSSSSLTLQQPNAPQTRSRLLQGPRIQSIPMTRLIQRRLSSVAEEDSSSYAPSSPHTHLQSARLDNNNNDPADVPTGDAVKTTKANIVETEDLGKENATGSVKGAEKTTVKKKWRSRKRVGAHSNQKK